MSKRPSGKLESRWTVVEGRSVHARAGVPAQTDGGSMPLVLVHGIGVSSRYMVPTIERLAPHYRVYAPDLPGFGRSYKPPRALNIGELADSLAAWMEAAGLRSAALLANSFGCQVVAELAVRHPERIEKAVLQGPTVDPAARTARQQIWRLLRNATTDPPSHALNIARDYRECGTRRLLGTVRYMLEDRIEEKLPRVRVPALVVRGARDPIVPQRWAEEVSALLPGGRLVVVPGAGHTMTYAAPLELARVVRPFLEETHADEERLS
ncbi:MAG TPA: alpha/beta hydrolase [Rubrobacteraceae bacterium]|nr:alpha/beta hydrolase [Rubrobacteraceae bacterium]